MPDGYLDGTPETARYQDFRARLNTFSRSFPRNPLNSALCTLLMTTGQRLQRGLLRQHFFFGFWAASLLGFT